MEDVLKMLEEKRAELLAQIRAVDKALNILDSNSGIILSETSILEHEDRQEIIREALEK